VHSIKYKFQLSPKQQHFMLWAMLVLFSVRSLVPIGFMPSQNSHDEQIRLEICLPSGHKAYTWINLNDNSTNQDLTNATSSDLEGIVASDKADVYTCAFFSINHMGMASGWGYNPLALIDSSFLSDVLAQYSQIFPKQYLGPPLGSRAPPMSAWVSLTSPQALSESSCLLCDSDTTICIGLDRFAFSSNLAYHHIQS